MIAPAGTLEAPGVNAGAGLPTAPDIAPVLIASSAYTALLRASADLRSIATTPDEEPTTTADRLCEVYRLLMGAHADHVIATVRARAAYMIGGVDLAVEKLALTRRPFRSCECQSIEAIGTHVMDAALAVEGAGAPARHLIDTAATYASEAAEAMRTAYLLRGA